MERWTARPPKSTRRTAATLFSVRTVVPFGQLHLDFNACSISSGSGSDHANRGFVV